MFVILFILVLLIIKSITGIGIHTIYNNVSFSERNIHYRYSDTAKPFFDFEKKGVIYHKITYFGIFKKPFCLGGTGGAFSGGRCDPNKFNIWLTLQKRDIPGAKKCEINYNEEEGQGIWYEIECFNDYGVKFYSPMTTGEIDYRDKDKLIKYNIPIPTKDNPKIEIILEN